MNKRIFSVVGFGFSQSEQRMLRNILSISSDLRCSYSFSDTLVEVTSDLIIINADDQNALAKWDAYSTMRPQVPAVMASKSPLSDSKYTYIRRPLVATQIHSILDLDVQQKQTPSSKIDILSKSFMFRNLSIRDLKKIISISKTKRIAVDEVVFLKNDSSDQMYIILSGRLKITTFSEENKEISLGTLGASEIFGEMSMLDGRGRSASVIAIAPSELLVIERKDFFPFLERHPKVAVSLLVVMGLRLRITNNQLESMFFKAID